jgi:ATP-binding cassette subfamily B multidrug efflux pump
MSQILFSLNVISMIFVMFVRARASWERVSAVLGTPASEVLEPSPPAGVRTTTTAAIAAPAVRFEGISFAYPGSHGRLVLEGVDLSCVPGGITAIIGPTGSGKSSLASLVPRFYEPSAGAVLVGGADVRGQGLPELRQRIALVPQKTVLFTGTIEENLRWGRKDATEAELRAATAAAQADEFVERFPEASRTMLGQAGVNLSGGQKQRLAIARALVRRPDVLILDDCTSSVDSITEAEILRAIRGFGAGGAVGGCTCLLITQRISAAAAADLVLVLEDGKAVGVGRHESLMRECEVYRDICIAQLGRESVGV